MSEQRETGLLAETCAALGAHRLPRWRELPDLELYMDQVLSLITRYLGDYPGFDRRGLTASMVNNYVKQGALPPPDKKRYGREHLAGLIVICILKASLPIAAIHDLRAGALESSSEEAFYDAFCALFERVNAETAAACAKTEGVGTESAVLRAALRAQAEQALAARLCAAGSGQDAP